MELEKIKQLIGLLASSDLSELELVEGEHRVRLVKRVGAGAADLRAVESGFPAAATDRRAPPTHATVTAASQATPGEVITAPLFGIVHLTPAPDQPAYVKPGDPVQAGQTLCVVEAMKMFHEVKADRAAEVLAILAISGQEVDAGQPLFRLALAE